MELPKDAKKVYMGQVFTMYEYPQKLFDGSTATFECIVRKPSTEVIIAIDNKILTLLQQQPDRLTPYPSLPGGRIEEGEDPLIAAQRELLEETGYKAENFTLFLESFGNKKLRFHESIFIAANPQKIAEPNLDAGEKMEIKWLMFEEFLQLCRNPSFATSELLRRELYEALLDKDKKEALRKKIFH